MFYILLSYNIDGKRIILFEEVELKHVHFDNNNNNNNICLKSNIQTSSVDYAPRELTHACSRSETCSRSDTEACDMCYVF